MSINTACRRCGERPHSIRPPRKRWTTSDGILWAYRCRCGCHNGLTDREGWREFAGRQAAKLKAE